MGLYVETCCRWMNRKTEDELTDSGCQEIYMFETPRFLSSQSYKLGAGANPSQPLNIRRTNVADEGYGRMESISLIRQTKAVGYQVGMRVGLSNAFPLDRKRNLDSMVPGYWRGGERIYASLWLTFFFPEQ